MQLKTLLAATPVREIIGPTDRAVESIAYDSRRVQRDGLFVALRGEKSDGHNFIGQAIEKGAAVIVAERAEKHSRATCVVGEHTRSAIAGLSARLYDFPARKAKLFEQLAQQQKKKKPVPVINIDDRYGRQLLAKIDKKVSVVTFGMGASADFRASNYRMEFAGTSYQLDARGKSYLVRVPLIGRFNVANSLAALAAATALGVGLREAVLSLAKSPQVPGRLEIVPAKRQFQVFVDYAHTPDALLNVIKTLRELEPRRLIVVFGCGGNRDREKRPLMGQVVDQKADYAIITSDNPRKEDPDKIIAEVEKGFRGNHFEKITDRAQAISRAIEIAQPRDIVLIAGKGHENYQEFADHTVPFEDIQVARRAVENHPVEFK